MIEFEPALTALTSEKVDFVVVGETAVLFHSSSHITGRFDFCYSRMPQNLKKIASALAKFNPRLRGFFEDLPFVWDERTLQSGTNFTLKTTIGDIDLLGEVAGVGDYQAVKKESTSTILYDCEVRVLTLEGLINAKRAAGRVKDLLVLPELEALREAITETAEKNQ